MIDAEENKNAELGRKKNKSFLFGIGIVVVVLLALFFAAYIEGNEAIQDIIRTFGYPGLFLFSALSGFNLLVPIPASSFIPLAIASDLNVWLIIATVSLGMTTGDAVGFLIGRFGRVSLEKKKDSKMIEKAKKFEKKYKIGPIVFLFLYATFAPTPNELVVIPFSFLKIKWWKIITAVFLGNLIFNTYTTFAFLKLLEFV